MMSCLLVAIMRSSSGVDSRFMMCWGVRVVFFRKICSIFW